MSSTSSSTEPTAETESDAPGNDQSNELPEGADDHANEDKASQTPPFILYKDGEDFASAIHNLQLWVNGLLLPVYGREASSAAPWCPRWWEHIEAVAQLYGLWMAWQDLTGPQSPMSGPSNWHRDHLGPVMTSLRNPQGPFSGCKAGSHRPKQAPPSIITITDLRLPEFEANDLRDLAKSRKGRCVEERIKEVDALRGFALLGILFVNAPVIAGAYDLHNMATTIDSADHIVSWAVTFLFTTKFYLLFSFLFGYSFTLQRAAATRTGVGFTRRHMRRLAGLFVIGSFHAVFLYPGDVLTTYSVLGLVLFAVRNLRARTALWSALALMLVLALCFFVIAYVALKFPVQSNAAQSELFHSDLAAYRGQTKDIVRANIRDLREALSGTLLYASHLLCAFLVGLAAGKRAIFQHTTRYEPHLKRVALYGLLLGVPGSAFMAACENGPLDDRYFYFGRTVGIIASPAMAASYAAGMLLFLATAPGRRIGATLAAAGRMALTNYLAQSLVLSLLFTGYGFAMYGRVGPAELTLWCVPLYGAQLLVSKRLMARVRYGPAELVLRGITGAAAVHHVDARR